MYYIVDAICMMLNVVTHAVIACWCCCWYRAVNPMFGDYFQHDAHELLCCVLARIDDALAGLRQFCRSAVSAMTSRQLHSPASYSSFSQRARFSHDTSVSPVTTLSSCSLRTRSMQSLNALPPGVKVEPQRAEGGLRQSVSYQWHSLPSSPCTSLVVELCMPLKCRSLGHLSYSSQQQLLSSVTVSPDLLCERLKRKRKSSRLSLTNCQWLPIKCKNSASSYCFSSSGDNLGKSCESAASDCLHDTSLTDCCQMFASSERFLTCSSADCCVLTESNDDTQLRCSTLPVSVPAANHCAVEVFPPANAKDRLLLSLQAIESGRSCDISLCYENISGRSSEADSHRGCTLNSVKTSVKHGGERGHVACVRDMFGGQMLTQTKCLNCGSVAKHSELYEDIAVFTGRCGRNSTCLAYLHSLPFVTTLMCKCYSYRYGYCKNEGTSVLFGSSKQILTVLMRYCCIASMKRCACNNYCIRKVVFLLSALLLF